MALRYYQLHLKGLVTGIEFCVLIQSESYIEAEKYAIKKYTNCAIIKPKIKEDGSIPQD